MSRSKIPEGQQHTAHALSLCVQIQFLQGRWNLQLLHSTLTSWLNMAAALAASRARLSHTLQRIHMQQLLQAWSLATQRRIQLKGAALRAWREHVHWQHQKPSLLSTATEFRKHRQAVCCLDNSVHARQT